MHIQHDYRKKGIKSINKNYVPYKCKCKFDGRKCNSNQKWNNDKCQSEFKNTYTYLIHVVVKMVNV